MHFTLSNARRFYLSMGGLGGWGGGVNGLTNAKKSGSQEDPHALCVGLARACD